MNNFYLLLKANVFSSQEEIKKAYRTLAKKYHPDKNKGNPQASANFRLIKEAYDWLKKNHVQQVKPPPIPIPSSSSQYPNNHPLYHDLYHEYGRHNINVAIGAHALQNVASTWGPHIGGLGNSLKSSASLKDETYQEKVEEPEHSATIEKEFKVWEMTIIILTFVVFCYLIYLVYQMIFFG